MRLTPSTATEPFSARKRASAGGAATREPPRFAGVLEARHRADAVDVAADEMAVEPVAGAQRLFEIDLAGAVEPASSRRGSRPRPRPRSDARAASSETTVMQAPASAMLSPSAVVVEPARRAPRSSSALPNAAPLPSARASTMRPTPLTMPVNMTRLSSPAAARDVAQASGRGQRRPPRRRRRGRSSRRRSVPTRSTLDEAKAERVVEARDRRERGQAAAAAEQARRDVDEQLVDEARARAARRSASRRPRRAAR